MPKFKVVRRYSTTDSLIIEADSPEEAEEIARSDDYSDKWENAELEDVDEDYEVESEADTERQLIAYADRLATIKRVAAQSMEQPAPTKMEVIEELAKWSKVPISDLISSGKAAEYPMTGEYMNDCPFCKTHNAILVDSFVDETVKCRDCGRRFKQDNGRKLYIPI